MSTGSGKVQSVWDRTKRVEKINMVRLGFLIRCGADHPFMKSSNDFHKNNMSNGRSKKFYEPVYEHAVKLFNKLERIPGTPYGILRSEFSTPHGQRGRLNAVANMSLQVTARPIRHAISGELYVDIDQCNSHPTLLVNYCRMMTVKTEHGTRGIVYNELCALISHKAEIYEALIEANKGKTTPDGASINKDYIKRMFLSLLNGGTRAYRDIPVKTDFLTRFKNEIAKIIDDVASNHPDLLKEVTEKREATDRRYNIKGALMNRVLQDLENRALVVMENVFARYKFNREEMIPIHDGMQVPIRRADGKKITPAGWEKIMKECEAQFEDKMNLLGLTLAIKPMDFHVAMLAEHGLTLPDDSELHYAEPLLNHVSDSLPIQVYNAEDPYCWRDFMTECMSKVWPSEDQLMAYVCSNANRVLVRTIMTKGYMIKLSRNSQIESVDDLPKFVVRYQSGEKGLIKTRQFKSFFENSVCVNSLKIYDNCVFRPAGVLGSVIDDDNEGSSFNTWTGFKARLLPKAEVNVNVIQPILDHIKEVIVSGNHDHYIYVLTWIHHILTNPRRKTKVAILLKSDEQQVGKGLFVEFLINFVFGKKLGASINGLKDLTARFNENVFDKLFINCDELSNLDTMSNYNAVFDMLKKIITDGTITKELKNGRKWTDADYANMIFCTQHDFTVKIEAGDARYCVFESSPVYRNNRAYFENVLQKCHNQNAGDHFLSYVTYQMFLGEGEALKDVRDIPQTQLRQDMINMSLPNSVQFLNSVYEEFADANANINDKQSDEHWWTHPPTIGSLYDRYRNYCVRAGESEKSIMKSVIFSKEMKKAGLTQVTNGRTRSWDLSGYFCKRQQRGQ
jgi:Family of unknown function (DUF5906)